MSTPERHSVVLPPPQPGMHLDTKEIYKHLYEIWKRTGGYESQIPDLKGLKASVNELNSLIGIRTDESVQTQLDLKENKADLGTLAKQDADAVNITGGTINNTQLNYDQIVQSTITTSTIANSDITINVGDTTNNVKLNGTLNVNTTPAGNVGSGETNLIIYQVLADSLYNNQEFIEIKAWGTLAANANNKQIKLYFGSDLLLDTGSVAANSGSWSIKSTIIRTSINTQQCISQIISDNALIIDSANYVDGTGNLDTDINIYCTGQGSATDDIVQKGLIVKWFNN